MSKLVSRIPVDTLAAHRATVYRVEAVATPFEIPIDRGSVELAGGSEPARAWTVA